MRCLIVDDEAPARDELRYLLDSCAGVQVIGAAATAEEAEHLLANVDYDVIFLDIRMPGMSGLELAKKLNESDASPAVIFTTAYPDHAVDAFALSASDYLLKPLNENRLSQAIERARQRRNSTQVAGVGGSNVANTATIAAGPTTNTAAPAMRLPIDHGDRTIFVNQHEIVAAAAASGYTYLYLENDRVLVTYTLAELEARFPDGLFRVHRSYLANLERLFELRPDFKGSLVLVMDDADRTKVPVARRQRQELRRRLGL